MLNTSELQFSANAPNASRAICSALGLVSEKTRQAFRFAALCSLLGALLFPIGASAFNFKPGLTPIKVDDNTIFVRPGTLRASGVSFDANYIANYSSAAGGWFMGRYFPNIVSGGTTWYYYQSQSGSCVERGYVRAMASGGRQPSCFPGPTGYDYQAIRATQKGYYYTSGNLAGQHWIILPGEIMTDPNGKQWGLVPANPALAATWSYGGENFNDAWLSLLGGGSSSFTAGGNTYNYDYSTGYTNQAAYYYNLPAGGGNRPNPDCLGTCYQVGTRYTVDIFQGPHGPLAQVWGTGVTTSGNTWQDFQDVFTATNYLNWQSNPQLRISTTSPSMTTNQAALLQFFDQHGIDASRVATVNAHSLGTIEMAGFAWAGVFSGNTVNLYAPPATLSNNAIHSLPGVYINKFVMTNDLVANNFLLGYTIGTRTNGIASLGEAPLDHLYTGTGVLNTLTSPLNAHALDNYTTYWSAPSFRSGGAP